MWFHPAVEFVPMFFSQSTKFSAQICSNQKVLLSPFLLPEKLFCVQPVENVHFRKTSTYLWTERSFQLAGQQSVSQRRQTAVKKRGLVCVIALLSLTLQHLTELVASTKGHLK